MKVIRRALILCCLLAFALAASAMADDGVLTLPASLTAIEAEAFYGVASADKVVVPESVATIGARAFAEGRFSEIRLPAAVTKIGAGAFRNCGKATASVRYYCLPAGVDVDLSAFEGCRADVYIDGRLIPYFQYRVEDGGVIITGLSGYAGIREAVIPATIDGVPVVAIDRDVFNGRSTLASVTIPATVTSIGANAFKNCSALTGVELPAGLTSIGSGAFQGSGLTGVDIPAGVTAIANNTFMDTKLTEVTIPAGVTSIGSGAFQSAKSLTRVDMPEGLLTIGESAFNDCYALAQADIPSTVTQIGKKAFRYCEALTRATIPSGVAELPEDAFIGCKSLESVRLPDALTALGESTFESCHKLTDINFPAGLASVGKRCFHYACYNQPGYPVYALPEGLSVGEDAFAACGAALCVARDGAVEAQLKDKGCTLTYPDRLDYRYQWKSVNDAFTLYLTGYAGAGGNVVIPAGPAVIGESAFMGNEAITGVTIPAGVTSIERYAFQNCANLAGAVVPEGVTVLKDCAFRGCASLTDVALPDSLVELGSDAFRETCTVEDTHFYNLPDHIATLGWKPFQGCGAVLCFNRGSDSASLFQQNQYIYTYAGETDFRYRWYENEGTEGHRERLMKYTGNAATVAIPGYIWLIDDEAFRGNTAIRKVVIPEGVTTLGFSAFRDCANLTDVTFPAALVEVKDNVFNGCGVSAEETFLFDLPDGIAGFGPGVFDNCPAILVCGLDSTTAARLSNRGYSFVRKDRRDELDIRYRYGYYNNIWKWGLYDYVGDLASVRLPDDCANVDSAVLRQKVKDGLELVCAQLSDTAEGLSRAEISFTFPGHEGLRYRIIESVLYVMSGAADADNALVIPKVEDYVAAGVDEQIRGGAFQGMEALTKAVIPEGVTRINGDVFTNCYNLADITFPSTLKSIDQNAFRWCGRDVEDVFYFVLPDDLEDIVGRGGGATTFSDVNAVLVCGKTSQTAALLTDRNYVYAAPGEYDFRYRYESYTEGGQTGRRLWLVGYEGSAKQVTIPAGPYGIKGFSDNTTSSYWRTFHADAFTGNGTVTKVVIPEGVVTIRDGSFNDCYKLTNITFPSTLKSLDQNVFRYCGRDAASTFYFVLPNNMESVVGRGGGAQTFSDCNAVLQTGKYSKTAALLTDANFCYTVSGERDFRYRYRSYDDSDPDRELWLVGYAGNGGTVTIPAGIYGVRRYQWDSPYGAFEPGFYGNEAVTKLVIPEGTVVIEDSAFRGCVNLTDISFPDSLKVLKNHAFEQCGKASSVRHYFVLPDDMTEISTNRSAGWGAFTDINNGVIVCAADSETARVISNCYTGQYEGYYCFALKGHQTDGLLYRYDRFGEEGNYEYRLILKQFLRSGAATGTVEIPSGCGLYAIENDVFKGDATLEGVVIPEGVVEIRNGAFDGCVMLHGGVSETVEGSSYDVIKLPESVRRIGNLAFHDVGSAYTAERFFLVLPGTGEAVDVDVISAFLGCNAVLVAPAGSNISGKLYEAWFYYYNTLEDAVKKTSCQYRLAYDSNGNVAEHVHYGRP